MSIPKGDEFAFPSNNDQRAVRGMTLRDWFAGLAMQTWVADLDIPYALVADKAYEMADYMLKARQADQSRADIEEVLKLADEGR